MDRTRLTRWLIPLPAILFALIPQNANAEPISGLEAVGYTITDIPPVRSDEEYVVCYSELENNINRNFDGEPFGDCPTDLFMVHYTGFIEIPENDTIQFMVAADDGGTMKIGLTEFGTWNDKGCSWSEVTSDEFSAGVYALDGWYYEHGGNACFMLAWNIDNEGWAIVPDEAFTQQAVATTTTTSSTTCTTTTTSTTTTTVLISTPSSTALQTTTSSSTSSTSSSSSSTTSSSTTTLPQETTTTSEQVQTSTTTSVVNTTTSLATTTTTTTQLPSTPTQTTSTTDQPVVVTSTSVFVPEPQPEPEPETTTTETTLETTTTTTSQPPTTEVSTAKPTDTTLSDVDQVEIKTPTTTLTTSTTEQSVPIKTTLTSYINSTLLGIDTPVGTIDDQQFGALVDQIDDNTSSKEIAAIVIQLLQYDITSEQATELATNSTVLATIDEQQAEQLFETIQVENLDAELLPVLIDAVQDAPTVVRNAFESKIDIFGGYAEQYVPVGSSVTVSVRRTIVAVSASMAIIATPVPTRRRQ